MDKTQHFINRARLIHSDKYDYAKTVYVRSMQKVIITCPTHGDFLLTPNNHLSAKQGCQKCSKRHHYTQEEFIQEATRIHNGKYDYSAVAYENNKTKVEIACQIHGSFFQTPSDHTLKLTGCPKCANATKGSYHQKDTIWFIKRGREIHGDKYDYSKVNYCKYHDKVEIVCPEHGSFFQSASGHIHNRSGCPTCSYKDYEGGYGKKRFDNHPELKTVRGMLYVLRIFNENEQFIKVGITQKSIFERFNVNNRLPYLYEELYTEIGDLYDMFVKEQHIKKHFKRYKYIPVLKFNGHSECFRVDAEKEITSYVQ